MSQIVAVILPAYNEALTVEATIRAFHTAAPQAAIWVVNNNSTDKTPEIAQKVISELSISGGVIDEPKQGKGNAVRRAFHDIDADVYVLADADMTYPAESIDELISPILAGDVDMVVGDRHSGGDYQRENTRRFHNLGNRLVQALVNWLFSASLVDIMSGYRAFNRLFVRNYPILADGFEFETEMTLHALDKRLRIMEIPVRYQERPAGSYSKLNTIRDGLRVIATITRILRYYRPLRFFGSAAIAFAMLGILAGIPVLDDWFRYRYIYHIPLAILATGLEIFAIVLFAIGLILDSITDIDKRNFERSLLKDR